MLAFSRRMTRVFTPALHLPEDQFDDYIKRPKAGRRILHYPQQEASEEEQTESGPTKILNASRQ
jgi:isopenicillin N synthase-like dioxygenase